MTLRALWAEGPMLLGALLVQALPGMLGQVATVGALLLLAFRLIWRALRPEAPPWMPGAAFLAFMIRVALALGVWVMLGGLVLVGLEGALELFGVAHVLRSLPALAGAVLIATPLTLALAVAGLAPPLLPAEAPRPGLLDALRPATLWRSALWLLFLVLPACILAFALRLFLPGPLAAAAQTAAVAITTLTLAHLYQGIAQHRPSAAIFA